MSGPVVWFVVGVVFFLTELFSPVFVMFFFGLGAWAGALALVLGASVNVALGVFAVISVGSLLLLRSTLVRTFQGFSRPAAERKYVSPHTGKLATVTRPIERGAVGEVGLGGSFWRAVSDQAPIAQGASVIVLGNVPNEELTLRVAVQPAESTEPATDPAK